ncbi:DEAD/DEAH box helicase [Streptomyces sp. NPDC005438]|uniref:DEAD/DEAH box helicase n=1 Tax=Streptomyces sp. NPDC005438 TaxID=3156880 RepID=UPI0033A6693C
MRCPGNRGHFAPVSRGGTLLRRPAVFLPADPPRHSTLTFWQPPHDPSAVDHPSDTPLTVVLPDDPTAPRQVEHHTVAARHLPLAEALPLLTRARTAADTHPATAFWGAATLLALQLAARGRLLPRLTPTDQDSWGVGPLGADDRGRLDELARSMPTHARAVPLEGQRGDGPPRLPDAGWLLSAFVDAVADGLPRTPAAGRAAGHPEFTSAPTRTVSRHRAWTQQVAHSRDSGVRLSLRVELDPAEQAVRVPLVPQVHSLDDPRLIADAADLWRHPPEGFGPAARTQTLLALRRAAAAWPPLEALLRRAVPDCLELEEPELAALLGEEVAARLRTAGVEVLWPRQFARGLTTRGVLAPEDDQEQPDGPRPFALGLDAVLRFRWRFALGGAELSPEELDRLAEAGRPLVRLRDEWVLVDPEALRRARQRVDQRLTLRDALGVALTGTLATEPGKNDDPSDQAPVPVTAQGWLEGLREQLADPEGGEPPPVPEELRATLRDYQRRGVGWLHRMTSWGLGACLADDMGLGKTVTLIALHLTRKAEGHTAPTLVVCPASLLGNWEREIARFAPGTPVRRFHQQARDLDGLGEGAFVLTTYGTLRVDRERLAATRWGMVVADEAQHAKNPRSATARALRALPTDARVALTGTPVENNLSELWALVDWATPGVWGSLAAFRARHADPVEAGDPEAAQRLARLTRPFVLRRRKSDPGVAPELPPKTLTDRAVSLTVEQTGLYEAVVRELMGRIQDSGGLARRGLVVKLLTALKQVCNHPAQYLAETEPVLEGRSGKLELLDELLDTLLAEEAGVLVFTQYVAMGRLLALHLGRRGIPVRFLHGSTPVAERDRMVREFQEHPEAGGAPPVFLLSLRAAGTGLNLTRASHVVHYDRWWNPAVEDQATDRAHRIGQQRPVQVHRLIAEGTVEDRIAELLRRKAELADSVLGAGDAALTELSDEELADLVRLGQEVPA